MRRLLQILLGALVIVVAVYLAGKIAGNRNKKRPTPKKVVKTVFIDTVKNETIPIIIPANGNLTAKRRVEIYSEVQGIFRPGAKLFKPGQNYTAGQAFIRIDDTEHFANVQSAKSNLYNSIAAIMPDLRLDFPEVFQKWQTYLSNFDLNKSTPSLPKMTNEKENYFITGRGIVSNYYSVKNLEQRLSKYNISAPFNGILVEALVTEGTLIRNGQKLGEFIDPSSFEMEVAISKTYSDLLKVGEKVTLNNIENTKSYIGTVTRINGNIDASTQTVTAFIEVKDKDLKEGIYLEAKLNARNEDNAIEVNRSLLLDGNQIFVVKDSILDIITAKPVYFSEAKVVLKDVPNGTVILSKPVPGAYAGMSVKPYKTSPESASTNASSEN